MVNLDNILNFAGKHARTILIEQGAKDLMPVFCLETPSGAGIIIGAPWENEQEKLNCIEAVRQLAREHKAVMCAFCGEAWVTKHHLHNNPWDGTPPSQSPNRHEVVFAIATDGRETKGVSWLIVRDEKGKITDLIREDHDCKEMGGRLIDNIIPPPTLN